MIRAIKIDQNKRSTSATVKQEQRYVAWHHFHPAAICCGNYNGKVEIPKQFVKDFIQKDGSDNGYEKNDIIDGTDNYYIVPSYCSDVAKLDISDATRNKNLLGLIEKATIGTTTRTPLATSNSEEGSNETPDEKEKRLLRKEIRDLKDTLKLLKAPSWTTHINDDNQNNNDNNNGTGLIGITRYTIQSDEYHQQNKNASNEFF